MNYNHFSLKRFSIILSLLSIFLFNSAIAQDEDAILKPGINWGVRAGASIVSMGSSQPYLRSRSGVYVGGIMEYAPFTWFSVSIKPGYNQYGGSLINFQDENRFYGDSNPIGSESENPTEVEEFEDRLFSTNSLVTVHVVEVPIIARFGLDLEKIRLFTNAGISSSYQAFATESFERTQIVEDFLITTSGIEYVTREYEPFQFGIVGGFGILFDAGEDRRIAFEVNYQRGLTPIKKSFSYLNFSSISGDLYADVISIGMEFYF